MGKHTFELPIQQIQEETSLTLHYEISDAVQQCEPFRLEFDFFLVRTLVDSSS
jgi:hypothetical protein